MSCEYEEHFTYSVSNELDRPVRVSFYNTGEGYNRYENSDIDTLLGTMNTIVIYEESGGLIGITQNAEDHRAIYWDIDSLRITLNDSIVFDKFSNSVYWSFSSDDADGEYFLVINEGNTN